MAPKKAEKYKNDSFRLEALVSSISRQDRNNIRDNKAITVDLSL